jgi:hypothetical protein
LNGWCAVRLTVQRVGQESTAGHPTRHKTFPAARDLSMEGRA